MKNFQDTDPYKIKQVSRYVDKTLKDLDKTLSVMYYQNIDEFIIKIEFKNFEKDFKEINYILRKIQIYLSHKYKTKNVLCVYNTTTQEIKISINHFSLLRIFQIWREGEGDKP